MRITLDRALFDVQSEAEATALVNLLGTAVRHGHQHALLTHPLHVLGGDNHEIDAWLASRSRFEADAYRAVFRNGIEAAAGVRSVPTSGPRLSGQQEATEPEPGTSRARSRSAWSAGPRATGRTGG